MRRLTYLFTLAIALFLFSGCSSDELQNTDSDYMGGLTRGEFSICYDFDSYEAYMRDPIPEARWEKQDMSEWVGWQTPGPGVLVIHDGKTWSPLELFQISLGWHPLYYPYCAYRLKSGSDTEFYVARPIQFDSESRILTLEDGVFGYNRRYEVESADEKGITLVYKEYDNSGEPTWKWILRYKKVPLDLPSLVNNPFYESNLEAKLAMIKLLKEEFGTPFDINPYFNGNIVFPGPFDLDKIEQYILDGTDWKGGRDSMVYNPDDFK